MNYVVQMRGSTVVPFTVPLETANLKQAIQDFNYIVKDVRSRKTDGKKTISLYRTNQDFVDDTSELVRSVNVGRDRKGMNTRVHLIWIGCKPDKRYEYPKEYGEYSDIGFEE